MKSKTFSVGVVIVAATLAALPSRTAHAAKVTVTGQHGVVAHGGQGYLGIDVRDVAEDQVSSLKLKDTRGAEIIRVDHDGPAGKMGLREHDVVLQMNGVAIEGEEQIRRMLRECTPGRSLVLVLSREGQQMTVTAQMADRSQVEKEAWEQHLAMPAGPQAPASALPTGEAAAAVLPQPVAPNAVSRYSKGFLGTLRLTPAYTGAMLERMGPQLAQFFGVPGGTGLLVRSVESNSPAAAAGLHAGDVVLKANAQTVGSIGDWARTIREARGHALTIVVLRDKQEKTLTLTPDGKHRSEIELPFDSPEPVRVARLTEL